MDYEEIFGAEKGLLDELLSEDDSEDEPTVSRGALTSRDLERTKRTERMLPSTSAASPGMSVAGRKAGRLEVMRAENARPSTSVATQDSSQPIARRTRATGRNVLDEDINLDDVLFDIDEQELEEIGNFGKVFDDNEEYQKFLASLQHFDAGEGAGGRGNGSGSRDRGGDGDDQVGDHDEDDEDDDDFIRELQEMIEDEVDDMMGGERGLFKSDRNLTSEMPIEKISSLFRKQGNYKGRKPYKRVPRELRRSVRVENQLNQKYFAARLLTKRSAMDGNGSGARRHFPVHTQERAALAALVGMANIELKTQVMKVGTRILLPTEFEPYMLEIEEVAKSVVWKPPLPSTIRKAHAKLELAMKEADGNVEMNPELRCHIQREHFKDHQRDMLMRHIRDHVQMCYQTLVLAVVQREDPEVVERLRQTLLSSVEGLFPVIRESGHAFAADLSVWEDGIHRLTHLIDSAANANDGSLTNNDYTKNGRRDITQVQKAAHVWSHLPFSLMRNNAAIRTCFNSAREPRQTVARFTKQQLFTRAEDYLLAWGIRKYGYDWEKIRADLLPNRTTDEIFVRKKHSVSTRKATTRENVIAMAVKAINMPLTDAEIALLKKATEYYGHVRKKKHVSMSVWETICSDYLPYRSPRVLSMLWAEELRRQAAKAAALANASANPSWIPTPAAAPPTT